MAALADGALLLLPERRRYDQDGSQENAGTVPFWYRPSAGAADAQTPAWREGVFELAGGNLEPSAAATGPNGDVFVLERSWPGKGHAVRVAVARIPAADLERLQSPEPDGVDDGTPRLKAEVLVDSKEHGFPVLDNFEGLGCFQRGGRTFLSDGLGRQPRQPARRAPHYVLLFELLG